MMYLFRVIYKDEPWPVTATKLRNGVLWYRLRKQLSDKVTQTVFVKATDCVVVNDEGGEVA